ncbi:MAG: hypothetical protein QF554_09940, partial [Dehalococcoidia bacterium]|nr:hypothetical protein [Dehalococcoidia bacterium]
MAPNSRFKMKSRAELPGGIRMNRILALLVVFSLITSSITPAFADNHFGDPPPDDFGTFDPPPDDGGHTDPPPPPDDGGGTFDPPPPPPD